MYVPGDRPTCYVTTPTATRATQINLNGASKLWRPFALIKDGDLLRTLHDALRVGGTRPFKIDWCKEHATQKCTDEIITTIGNKNDNDHADRIATDARVQLEDAPLARTNRYVGRNYQYKKFANKLQTYLCEIAPATQQLRDNTLADKPITRPLQTHHATPIIPRLHHSQKDVAPVNVHIGPISGPPDPLQIVNMWRNTVNCVPDGSDQHQQATPRPTPRPEMRIACEIQMKTCLPSSRGHKQLKLHHSKRTTTADQITMSKHPVNTAIKHAPDNFTQNYKSNIPKPIRKQSVHSKHLNITTASATTRPTLRLDAATGMQIQANVRLTAAATDKDTHALRNGQLK